VPRIRSIHPDTCDDEVVARLSPYAFRTWVLLWTHLDDKGRGVDSAKLWAGKLYPLNDKMTEERVEKDLAELEAEGLLHRYEVAGRRYLSCKPESWARWQKPQHPTPSKLPEPPLFVSGSGEAQEAVANGSLSSGGELSVDVEEGESEGEVADPVPVDKPSPLQERALRGAAAARAAGRTEVVPIPKTGARRAAS